MAGRAAPHLRLPFEIAINTAQRQGDILAMSWKDYDGTHLFIRQSKGGKRVKVRVHRDLKAVLDAMPKDTIRILTNSRGRPWTKDGFKTSWGKECAEIVWPTFWRVIDDQGFATEDTEVAPIYRAMIAAQETG